MLLLFKKHTDTLIEQTKSLPQETLAYTLKKQMEVFSINPTIYLFEEGNMLLAVTSFEASNSDFQITVEDNSFSRSTPSHWFFRAGAEIITKLQKLIEMRHIIDIDLHVEDVRKRGNQITIGDNFYNNLILILVE